MTCVLYGPIHLKDLKQWQIDMKLLWYIKIMWLSFTWIFTVDTPNWCKPEQVCLIVESRILIDINCFIELSTHILIFITEIEVSSSAFTPLKKSFSPCAHIRIILHWLFQNYTLYLTTFGDESHNCFLRILWRKGWYRWR